jgi:transcriptional regulator with XRE-family HTH domain
LRRLNPSVGELSELCACGPTANGNARECNKGNGTADDQNKDGEAVTETFGERLRRLRLERGFSVEAVASKIGVTHSIVRRAEYGDQMVRATRLATLARVLGVSVDYLLTGRESPHVAALHQAILRSPQRDDSLIAMVRSHTGLAEERLGD